MICSGFKCKVLYFSLIWVSTSVGTDIKNSYTPENIINMNKAKLSVLCLSFATALFSQELSKRITINNPTHKTHELLIKNGIDLRCGSIHKSQSLQLELSQTELDILKKENIPYTVTIEDVATFYQKRSLENLPKAVQKLQLEKSYQKKSPSNTIESFLQYEGCNEVDWTVPSNFNLGSMGGCLTVSETLAELDQMRALYPNLISAKLDASPNGQKTYGNQQGTTTWNGQTVYYVRITGDQSAPEGTKPQTLYTSMLHSREVNSLMTNIFYMWYLLENYATDSAVKNLVDNNELYFIPIVNPDGLRWNEHIAPNGGGMQRKNLRPNTGGTGNTSQNRGVDLNRNFDYFWGSAGVGSSNNPSNDTYRGPSAFSEPETQILRDFVLNRNIKTCLMNHSFANAIPHPYGGNTLTSGREDEMHKWHEDMTKYNRYISGAEIFYSANGIADDWMVGGNTDGNGSVGSGRNILATTPEHGGTGFWPNPTDIVPIAKRAVRIYLMNAYYGGKYAKLHDLTQSDINSLTSNLTFGVERIGQTDSNFTLTLTPISSNISSISSPVNVTNINLLGQKNATASLVLNNTIAVNDKIEYNVKLSNDQGVIYDANFEKHYSPSVLLNDVTDTNGLTNWNSSGWSTTTTDAYSGNTALRSNNSSPYPNNANNTLTLKNSYNLSNSSKVIVQFYTKWDIERNFDFVEVQASTNGSNWQTLCGKYSKPSATSSSNNSHSQKNSTSHAFQANNSSGNLYDGDQFDNWVMEEIIIDANTNASLLNATNAKFRFKFRSDANNKPETYSTTYDGFFVDDFKIISISTPCEASTPTNIVTSNVTSNSIQVNWNAVPSTTYDLRYRAIGTTSWTNSTDLSSTTTTISGLAAETTYEIQVRAKCGSSISPYSSSVNATTAVVVINYCSSQGNNVNYEWIDFVSLADMSNSSGKNNGYGDFTSNIANVSQGSSQQLTVSAAFSGGSYNEYWSAWIDYNQNGTFENSERVMNTTSSSSGNIVTNITIPNSASIGQIRMRVIVKYGSASNPCDASFTYGEVEDYTVNISNSSSRVNTDVTSLNSSINSIFPNPALSYITINGNGLSGKSYSIINTIGQIVKSGKLTSNLIDISNLQAGVYLIQMDDTKLINKKFIKK